MPFKSVLLIIEFLLYPFFNCFAGQLEEIEWMKTRDDLGNPGFIANALFTPGDTSILIGGTEKFLELDAATGAIKRSIPVDLVPLKFSNDGKYLYVCTVDNISASEYFFYYNLRKVSYPSLEVVATFESFPWRFNDIDINEDAGIAIGTVTQIEQTPPKDSGLCVYDLNTYSIKSVLSLYANYFYTARFINGGANFLTISQYDPDLVYHTGRRNVQMLWDSETLDSLHEINGIGGTNKTSPDGKWFVTCTLPFTIVYNNSTFEKIYQLGLGSDTCLSTALDFTQDSKYLVTGGSYCDGRYSVWDLSTGGLVYKYQNVFSIDNIIVSQDYHILAFTTEGMVLLNWMLPTGIPEIQKKSTILYPNPTSGFITLQNPNFIAGHLQIELIDANGKSLNILFNGLYQKNSLNFDLSGYPAGAYILKAKQNSTITTYKIIKDK